MKKKKKEKDEKKMQTCQLLIDALISLAWPREASSAPGTGIMACAI